MKHLRVRILERCENSQTNSVSNVRHLRYMSKRKLKHDDSGFPNSGESIVIPRLIHIGIINDKTTIPKNIKRRRTGRSSQAADRCACAVGPLKSLWPSIARQKT